MTSILTVNRPPGESAPWHALAVEEALAAQRSRADGLSSEEVRARREVFGANAVQPRRGGGVATHAAADARPYRWEFTEQGRNFSVDVPARVLTTDPAINIRLACEGTGLTMAREDRMRDEIARGALVRVLDEFSTPFPGYYLYYPQRRHASPALRALVDYVRRARQDKVQAPKRQRREAGPRKAASRDGTTAPRARR